MSNKSKERGMKTTWSDEQLKVLEELKNKLSKNEHGTNSTKKKKK